MPSAEAQNFKRISFAQRIAILSISNEEIINTHTLGEIPFNKKNDFKARNPIELQ